MSDNIFRAGKCQLMVVVLLALGTQLALASNAPQVSGSYEVVQNTALGSQAQIQMRIHLVNHGPSDLTIQKMILGDFSHPARSGTHASAVTLRAHASAETIQEFTIERSEYRAWQKGLRPRLILRIGDSADRATTTSTKSTAVVRLTRTSARISSEEAK
ncbi:MAG: hypothetical protein WCF68_15755 [Terriglobales bacterium]